MSSDNDVLVELSNGEIEEFHKFYKNLKDPEFFHVHLYLKNHLRWNRLIAEMDDHEAAQISDRCKMKIYRNRNGKPENRTLIGITGDQEYTIFIMSLDKSLNELRQCLEQSRIIKWNQLPMFVAVHRRFHKMMYEILEVKGVRVRLDNYCSTIWMEKSKTKTYEFSVPGDVVMKHLSVDDSRLINDAWPYRYPGSEKFIKSIIKLNCSLGIYKNGNLVSWILQVECFGLGLLQTLDDHQGKGYARLLTRAMARKISEEFDEDVILFASYSKPKTVELYIRYGYKHISYTHWLYLKNA